ncbi:hypothetical protein EYF80_031648 [Liparis tanakae]|uniref:Uncharacterized protein n=1 Tax=Liparis tanakae TaxID=230148 RepID=A0A4Z2GYE4_9TELE|nr:hypothetical protein EYF80_031648 [Liparis tanakae]
MENCIDALQPIALGVLPGQRPVGGVLSSPGFGVSGRASPGSEDEEPEDQDLRFYLVYLSSRPPPGHGVVTSLCDRCDTALPLKATLPSEAPSRLSDSRLSGHLNVSRRLNSSF